MTHVLGTTTIHGHCVFHWYERQFDGRRTVEVEPHHCPKCVEELLRGSDVEVSRLLKWPSGTRPPPARAPAQAKILLVDDDEDVRTAVGAVLRMTGYGVATASNGEQALQILSETEAPCLVLLDLAMPVMGGHAVLSVMRNDRALSRIPVIVVSAEVGTERPRGCDVFLRKPLAPPTLLAAVARIAARAGRQGAPGR